MIDIIKKLSVVLLILLLIITSIASSPGFKLTNSNNYIWLDEANASKLLSQGKIAYAYCSKLGPHEEGGPYVFPLDNPNNMTYLYNDVSVYFPASGTWKYKDRWLFIEYFNGALYEIDPETWDIMEIGGGGTILLGLSYNSVNEKLYGASLTGLYEINITSGEQTFIGEFGNSIDLMTGIAFDAEGVLYGWDIGHDSLWIIDIETGESTLASLLDLDLKYASDGHFDLEDDMLYLTVETGKGQCLYKCDKDTGKCIFIGSFPGGCSISAFVIPYGGEYPIKPKITGPYSGRPGIPNNFCAYNEGNAIYYKWNWGDGNFSFWKISDKESYSWTNLGEYDVSVIGRNIYGDSQWSESIKVKIEDFCFIKAFIFGFIDYFNIIENLTFIEADSIFYLSRNLLIKRFNSGERIIISDIIFGKIKSNFIFGFFNADVVDNYWRL